MKTIILVLGQKLLPSGDVSMRFRERIEKGITLLSEDPTAELVISGGETRPGFPSEALQGLQLIPTALRSRTLLETKSRRTWDHPKYLHEVVDLATIGKLHIVTSTSHVFRARAIFKRSLPQLQECMEFHGVGKPTVTERIREAVLLVTLL